MVANSINVVRFSTNPSSLEMLFAVSGESVVLRKSTPAAIVMKIKGFFFAIDLHKSSSLISAIDLIVRSLVVCGNFPERFTRGLLKS